MTDLRALREAAEKATQDPWVNDAPACVAVNYPEGGKATIALCPDGRRGRADAAFIALANPAAIIALLDRLKEAEEALALIKGETRGCSQDMGFDREIGPLGCALGDKCVCAPVHMIARAHLERHNNE